MADTVNLVPRMVVNPLIKTREQIDKEITAALQSMGFKPIGKNGKAANKLEKEKNYMDLFLQTNEGKKWLKKNKIESIKQGDSPDYIFESQEGKKLGFEITELMIKTPRFMVLTALNSVLKKVCQHFYEKEGVNYHIILDIWDESDFILPYKPWYDRLIKKLELSPNDIKNAIIKSMFQKPTQHNPVVKTSVDISPHQFNITYSIEPYMSAHINVWTDTFEKPIGELQKTIDKKNKKAEKYVDVCDSCAILIVSDYSENLGYANFEPKELKSRRFVSAFKDIFLLEIEGSNRNVKTTKLKIKQCEDKNVQ